MQFWNELEGSAIEGVYPLQRLLRSEGRSAWFETRTETGEAAVISVTESITDDDEIVERLRTTEQLRQPNLVTIYKVGRAQINDTLVVYALMEHTDETLANVLRERPLTKDEATQMAESMVDALTSIHQRGLVHGRVEPASVLAAGETIKLRSDCIQPPSRNGAGASAPSDIAGLGVTVFQAFTQRRPQSSDDPQINRLPAPFAAIVKNALSERWGLAQIASVLRPGAAQPGVVQPGTAAASAAAVSAAPPAAAAARPAAPPPPAPPPPRAPTSPAAERTGTVSSALGSGGSEADRPPRWEGTPAAAGAGAAAQAEPGSWQPPSRPAKAITPDREPSSRRGVLIAAGLVLLLLVGWFLFRPHSQPAQVGPGGGEHAAPAERSENAAPPPSASEAVVPAHPDAALTRGRESGAPAAAAMPSRGVRSVWRVVAYTYDRRAAAQQKADQLSQQHPDLHPEVFSPKGDRGPYLVTLGGAMDREQAGQLRTRARQLGLPPDTYVQNFHQ